MATYTSPVSLANFQTYLKDSSTDTTLTGFYQSLLDTATEYVYNWLDRDYTASASKTDIFWGDDTQFYAPRHQAGTLTSWHYLDSSGVDTNVGTSDLMLRANGYLIQASTKSFISGVEHRLVYAQPSTLTCPETIRQVVMELAALYFEASNQGEGSLGLLMLASRDGGLGSFSDRERFGDLTERHKETLRPYKRYPV
jgi:hypothetical protein